VRAISTVLDVSLFLLLVGAAVATVAFAAGPSIDGEPDGTDPADQTAETLATSTVRVDYSIGAALAQSTASDTAPPDSPIHERSDHGTYAGLLGEAAVATAAIEDSRLILGGEPFAAAVRDATERAIRRPGIGTAVRAKWSPYPEAVVEGSVRTGDRPPRDVDVRTASVVVDSRFPDVRTGAIDAAEREGYRGVAAVLADATVRGLFPERESRVAARGAYPTRELAEIRYAAAGDALGLSTIDVADGYVGRANERLRSALRVVYEEDLRARYDDPVAAARDVSIGDVTVVVRTWSR